MNGNQVINCTLIIRSQAEYNPASQTLSVRCFLETPVTGEHQGFIDIEALISALRTELIETHNQIVPSTQEEDQS